jgi:hypothetical protein
LASRSGVAEFTAPAAIAGALWLISYRRDAPMSTATNAQEVSVTGTALGPRLKLPAGHLIDQGTRAGLLLVQELAGPGSYELWDPGTRRVTRSLVNLIAASPAEIAWMPICTAGCRVHVLDLPSGQRPGPGDLTARAQQILRRRVQPGRAAPGPPGDHPGPGGRPRRRVWSLRWHRPAGRGCLTGRGTPGIAETGQHAACFLTASVSVSPPVLARPTP